MKKISKSLEKAYKPLKFFRDDMDKHLSTIRMCYSYKKTNFFKRNKDAILVAVITAIITFLVTILGAFVVQWLTKKP